MTVAYKRISPVKMKMGIIELLDFRYIKKLRMYFYERGFSYVLQSFSLSKQTESK